ncbi:Ig-like domain-containing protein [Pontibacter sp. H249]|uniref:Ig-like domain-containing protein n=1 Tax=Pontibacter sp. H249 TaxID=3133420 RepID=UPI0030BD2FC5
MRNIYLQKQLHPFLLFLIIVCLSADAKAISGASFKYYISSYRIEVPQLQAKPSLVGANRLTWSAVDGATGYVLEMSNTGNSGTFVPLKTFGATENNYRHTGLYYSQKVYYRLQVTGSNGEIAYSAVVNTTTHAQSKVFNIMPLGDSNTEGGTGAQSEDIKISYRARLAQLLDGTVSKGKYDFVGSKRTGGALATDIDHAGFGGATIQNITALLRDRSYGNTSNTQGLTYLQEFQPDIILLHIGTNAVDRTDAAMENLEALLNEVDKYESTSGKDVTVVLAKIIKRVCYDKGCPTSFEAESTLIYNSKMETLAQKRQAAGDNLLLVNMQDGAGIDYRWGDDGGDMQDHLHPAQRGYDKMAPVWFAELDKLLNVQPVSPPDTQAPETTIATKPATLTNTNTATFSFTSNESDVIYLVSINGAAFTEVSNPYTINNVADGTHTLAVKARDAAGNIDETPASFTWTIDTKAPAAPVVLTPAEDAVLSNSRPAISGTAEANATVSLFSGDTQLGTANAGTSGSWSFTPVTALADGEQQITAKATDAAGNTGNVSNVRRFTIDAKAPETTIATKPDAITNQSTATFTFSSNEEGVTYEVSLNGGAYEEEANPFTLQNLQDGAYTLAVKATDKAGNTDNSPATYTWTIDTQAPEAPALLSISEDRGPEADDKITSDNTLIVKGTAEVNTQVQLYNNGSAIGQVKATATGAWEFDYTSEELSAGSHTFTATTTDAAGNTSQQSVVLKVTIDLSTPEATITTAQKSPVKEAFEVEISFTEQVFGLALSDFSVTNGTISQLESINSSTYKAIISPVADGEIKLSLGAGKVTDLAGNQNKASEILEILYDGTKPQLSINTNAPAITKEAFTVTFTFSEDVTEFEAGDVAVVNASVSGFRAQSAKIYTLLLTPEADGEVSIKVEADKAFDAAGNGNMASAVLKRIYDIQQPGVVLSTTAPNPTNAPFTVKVEFTENVTGLELADLTFVNGAASQLSKVNDKAYTLLVTPAASGEVKILLAADKVEDIATNGNAASNELKLVFDATLPEVVLSTDAPSPTNKPFAVTVKLSEPVTAFNAAALALTNATAGNLQKVSDLEYKLLITPQTNGAVTVQLPENSVQDAATNGNIVSNELSILYDVAAPANYRMQFAVELVTVENQGAVALKVEEAELGATYFYTITSSNGGEEIKGTATVNTTAFNISGLDVSALQDGILTASLYLVDKAGNKGATVTDQVEKITKNIIAVEQPASIKVPFRTAFNRLPLPERVKVTYATNEQESIKVNWQQGNYSATTPGVYVLEGTLDLAPKTYNTENRKATLTVEVEPNKVPTALNISTSSFRPDVDPTETIGTFSTTDPDDNEFTYALVAGQGDTDNNLFELLNNNQLHLKTNSGLSGKTKFSIRVQSMDPFQNVITKEFILTKTPFNKPDIKLVNAFSPDGDGINDTWTVPELRFYDNIEIEVFNRAGERVFHTQNPEEGWDGKGTDGNIIQGSYFYIIQVKDLGHVQKGVVTVLK